MNVCISREEFIATLKSELHNIDPSELEEVLRYYNEYLDDAQELGEDNLQKVLVELGSPKKIALEIRQNTAVKDLLDKEKKRVHSKNIAIIILGIFLLPITFSLVMTFPLVLCIVGIFSIFIIFTFLKTNNYMED